MTQAIKRISGFRWFERGRLGWEARFNWGEVTGQWGLALALCSFEEHFSLHIHLGYPNIFIKLPILDRWHREPEEMMDAWGVSVFVREGDVHLNWGSRTKIIHLPWDLDFHRRSILLEDGTWFHEMASDRIAARKRGETVAYHEKVKDAEDRQRSETHPYRYELQSGEVQERQADIAVHEYEWRRRFMPWLPIFAKRRRSIEVKFNDEVGERSGSWKGGCIGCAYEMRGNERPVDTLRRMERERSF